MEDTIKRVLEISGMTQKELADKLHVTPQAVSKWCRGESRPSLDNAIGIYELTGIDVIMMTNTARCSKENMKMKDLAAIDDYSKAQAEAEAILQAANIRVNYTYPVYKLCSLLLPAVIGLTHHQMLNKQDKQDEQDIDYSWIFTNLSDYLNEECPYKQPGLYENYLEYAFFRMGGDLFESFEPYLMPDHEYCRMAMYDWYRFGRAFIKSASSPIYNELLVAITELAALEDEYFGACGE